MTSLSHALSSVGKQGLVLKVEQLGALKHLHAGSEIVHLLPLSPNSSRLSRLMDIDTVGRKEREMRGYIPL